MVDFAGEILRDILARSIVDNEIQLNLISDQYQVKVDGSGRITLRNRRFLQKFTPITSPEPPRPIDVDLGMRLAPTTRMTPLTIPPMLPSPPVVDPTTPAGPAPAPDVARHAPSLGSPSPVAPTAVTPSYTGHHYPEPPDNAELNTTS